MRIRRGGIQDVRVDVVDVRRAEVRPEGETGVAQRVLRQGQFVLVEVQTVAAAHNQFVLEHRRAPCKADLGSEVVLLCVPCAAALADGHPAQEGRTGARYRDEVLVVLLVQRSKVVPAQAEVDRQVLANLPVILGEDAPHVRQVVLANDRGVSSGRIECAALVVGSVIQEVPDVVEVVARNAAAVASRQVVQLGIVHAELEGVLPLDLGGYVLKAIGPLLQVAADIGTEGIEAETAHRVNLVAGQAHRGLRVGTDFVPVPAGHVATQLVQERGREGMVPNHRVGFVDLMVVEDVIAAVAVEEGVGLRHPVDHEAQRVVLRRVGVNTAGPLIFVRGGRVGELILRHVRRGAQAAAHAGGRARDEGQILVAQSRGQRRADVDTAGADRAAVDTFSQSSAETGAAGGTDGSIGRVAREVQILVGNAAGIGGQCVKSRRVIPSGAPERGLVFLNCFQGQEAEELVLPQWAANAAAQLVELVIILENAVKRVTYPLVSVQARAVTGEEEAAMHLVGAALRRHIHARAGKAPVFGVIRVGYHVDAGH